MASTASANGGHIVALFVMGRPGSGKTELCGQLARRHGFQHIDVRAILQRLANTNTATGRKVGKYLAGAHIVPAALTLEIVRRAMSDMAADKSKSNSDDNGDDDLRASDKTVFVIEGFPRDAQGWKLWCESALPPAGVIHLKCGQKEARRRLVARAGPFDSSQGIITAALSQFEAHTGPALAHAFPDGTIAGIKSGKGHSRDQVLANAEALLHGFKLLAAAGPVPTSHAGQYPHSTLGGVGSTLQKQRANEYIEYLESRLGRLATLRVDPTTLRHGYAGTQRAGGECKQCGLGIDQHAHAFVGEDVEEEAKDDEAKQEEQTRESIAASFVREMRQEEEEEERMRKAALQQKQEQHNQDDEQEREWLEQRAKQVEAERQARLQGQGWHEACNTHEQGWHLPVAASDSEEEPEAAAAAATVTAPPQPAEQGDSAGAVHHDDDEEEEEEEEATSSTQHGFNQGTVAAGRGDICRECGLGRDMHTHAFLGEGDIRAAVTGRTSTYGPTAEQASTWQWLLKRGEDAGGAAANAAVSHTRPKFGPDERFVLRYGHVDSAVRANNAELTADARFAPAVQLIGELQREESEGGSKQLSVVAAVGTENGEECLYYASSGLHGRALETEFRASASAARKLLTTPEQGGTVNVQAAPTTAPGAFDVGSPLPARSSAAVLLAATNAEVAHARELLRRRGIDPDSAVVEQAAQGNAGDGSNGGEGGPTYEHGKMARSGAPMVDGDEDEDEDAPEAAARIKAEQEQAEEDMLRERQERQDPRARNARWMQGNPDAEKDARLASVLRRAKAVEESVSDAAFAQGEAGSGGLAFAIGNYHTAALYGSGPLARPELAAQRAAWALTATHLLNNPAPIAGSESTAAAAVTRQEEERLLEQVQLAATQIEIDDVKAQIAALLAKVDQREEDEAKEQKQEEEEDVSQADSRLAEAQSQVEKAAREARERGPRPVMRAPPQEQETAKSSGYRGGYVVGGGGGGGSSSSSNSNSNAGLNDSRAAPSSLPVQITLDPAVIGKHRTRKDARSGGTYNSETMPSVQLVSVRASNLVTVDPTGSRSCDPVVVAIDVRSRQVVSQTERAVGTADPVYAQELVVQHYPGQRQLVMFSVYDSNEDAAGEQQRMGSVVLEMDDLTSHRGTCLAYRLRHLQDQDRDKRMQGRESTLILTVHPEGQGKAAALQRRLMADQPQANPKAPKAAEVGQSAGAARMHGDDEEEDEEERVKMQEEWSDTENFI